MKKLILLILFTVLAPAAHADYRCVFNLFLKDEFKVYQVLVASQSVYYGPKMIGWGHAAYLHMFKNKKVLRANAKVDTWPNKQSVKFDFFIESTKPHAHDAQHVGSIEINGTSVGSLELKYHEVFVSCQILPDDEFFYGRY